MSRTAELSIESRTEPESGVTAGHAGNGHVANGHGNGNGAADGREADGHGNGHACCTPPLEAAWLERVETTPLRRTPDDVEPSDVLPSPCGEG